MEFILDLLYIYIAVFTAYFFILSIRNLKDSNFKIEKRYSEFDEKNNLAVIIYSHNNKEALSNLVNLLKLQEYPINKFKVISILDNCNDGSNEIFLNDSFLICIKFDEFQGKDKAISLVLEQLQNDGCVQSYVFIDANRSVSNDFLSNVNTALTKHSVVIGDTIMISESNDFVEKIKLVFYKYSMNFIKQARTLLGLAVQIDSGALIMKKSVIDKIGSIDFSNVDNELKYSLLLTKIGEKCAYNPNIQTFIQPDAYIYRRPRLSNRLKLFINCIKEIRFKNFPFTEQVVSLIAPNFWLLVISYLYLIKHSYKYYFFVDVKFVTFTFLLLIGAYTISLINSKLNIKETVILCVYPIYSICHIVKNLPPVRNLLAKFSDGSYGLEKEKYSIDVVVSTSKCDLPCKLEFISDRGIYKVRFLYKNKKYVTSGHLRIIDALQELKLKLDDYGFILKICNCCSFYKPDVEDTDNMLKGYCMSDYPSPYIKEAKPTLIWSSCPKFSPAKLNSLIEEMVAMGKEE